MDRHSFPKWLNLELTDTVRQTSPTGELKRGQISVVKWSLWISVGRLRRALR